VKRNEDFWAFLIILKSSGLIAGILVAGSAWLIMFVRLIHITMMNKRGQQVFTDLLMILFCAVFPHVARLPMLIYPAIVLPIVWLYLRWKKQTFADIGFRWKDLSFRSAIIGAAFGIVWTAIVVLILGPGLLRITNLPTADLRDFYFIRNSNSQFIRLLLVACLWVIPYEEIIFRGFIFTTTRKWFSFWTAGVVTSVLFAAYHWQEGASAVITIFGGSLVSTWLLRLFRFNLWYVIFFHITYDIIMLSLLKAAYIN
jgi:membrane protease YdiL (CAAX protease family)